MMETVNPHMYTALTVCFTLGIRLSSALKMTEEAEGQFVWLWSGALVHRLCIWV